MEPLSSKASFSSSDDSEFNDDSDVEDTDDVSMHINGWTSGAKANLKSSQFVIEDNEVEKFERRNSFRQRQVREANADVMSQIDKVMTDINFNELQDPVDGDTLDEKKSSDVKIDKKSSSNHFQKRPSFHELTGTAIALSTGSKPKSKPKVKPKPKTKSKPPLNENSSMATKLKKMSILGRKKSPKKSSTSRKSFQALPQSLDDEDIDDGGSQEEKLNDDDEENPKQSNQSLKRSKIRRPRFNKPKNVDDIANKYLFSSKKTKKLEPNPESEEDFEAIIASSNAILNGSIHPSISIGENYNGDDYIQNSAGNSGEQETVVFNYDEELHDFVPAKRSVNTSSYMKEWWKNRPSSNTKPNKNIRKMVRFSSDLHMYGVTEEDIEESHRRGKDSHNYTTIEMRKDNYQVFSQERRAAISYLFFVLFMSIIYLVGISFWNPTTHQEIGWSESDSPPELDFNADGDDIYHIPEFENKPDDNQNLIIDGNSTSIDNGNIPMNNPIQPAVQTESPMNPTIDNSAPLPSPNDSPTGNETPLTREDVFHIIQTISPKESILKAGSVQNRAGTWVAENYPSDLTSENSYRIIQRYVLATLFFALNGDTNWKSSGDWLSEKNECNWFGISCTMEGDLNPGGSGGVGGNDQSMITGIALNGNGLSGSLPPEIGFFDNLKSLWLFNNKISGQIPYSILRTKPLVQLYLNSNEMTGEIPKDIGMLENLENLDLSANNFNGKIPNGIGNMENLADLRLSDNQLTGEFPVEILDLKNMREILLENNQIEGEIPGLIGSLGSLLILKLSNNEFYGPIPDEIGNLSNLRELFLDECMFTGPIPRTIQNLKELRKLNLSKNELKDEIPNEIKSLENLELLDLNNNPLGGYFPSNIGFLSNLLELNLESTEVKGEIPNTIKNLDVIEKINLGSNMLSGRVPEWFGQFKNLQELDLNNNLFHGMIPDKLSSVKSLDELKLDENNFSGVVPDGLCELKLSILEVDCDLKCSCSTNCN